MRTEDERPQGEATRLFAHSDELGPALVHGLDLPIAALRATMESLGDTLLRDQRGHRLLEGVLAEVDRLGKNVRDLVDYASPRRPAPLRCTAAEIALSAREGLPLQQRARVLTALDGTDKVLVTDAALLSRDLRRLLENALEASSREVLVVVHHDTDSTRFAVVDDSDRSFDEDWARSAFHSTKRNHLGLGLAIAARDIELMNGTLEIQRTPHGETIATITVPDRVASQEAAA